jgi:hypothetical protein
MTIIANVETANARAAGAAAAQGADRWYSGT